MKDSRDRSPKDPLEEIRAVRDAHAEKFNYDIDAIFADTLRRERERTLVIDEVRYIKDFQVEIVCSNQPIRQIDLEHYIKSQKARFELAELRDAEYFKSFLFNASSNTLEWANGASILLTALGNVGQVAEEMEKK